jgi:hypothetical protein
MKCGDESTYIWLDEGVGGDGERMSVLAAGLCGGMVGLTVEPCEGRHYR